MLMLHGLVLVAGAVLFGLEICASRILQIPFGSTVYVWSSVIGVFLLCLATGNLIGGRIADLAAKPRRLSFMGMVAGIWIAVCPFWVPQLSSAIATLPLPPTIAATIATLTCFGAPAVVMGALTPCALRIAGADQETVGATAGRLYGLSNIGSIAGVFLVSFIAARTIRVSWTMIALGILLAVVSAGLYPLKNITVPARQAAKWKKKQRKRRATEAEDLALSGAAVAGVLVLIGVSSAILMTVEVAGAMVLQGHFGARLYVWGAVIGAFLAAITIGNVLGGKLADRCPQGWLLSVIMILAGIWIISVPLWEESCNEWLRPPRGDDVLPGPLGAFVAVCILYGAPIILVGVAVPFGLRLLVRTKDTLGRVSGLVYAVNNCGAIAGTFAVPFVLVHFINYRMMLVVSGGVGVGAALLMLACWRKSTTAKTQLGSVLAMTGAGVATLVLAVISWQACRKPGVSLDDRFAERLVDFQSTPYNRVLVTEVLETDAFRPPEEPGNLAAERFAPRLWTRTMKFNQRVQSAVFIDHKKFPLPSGLPHGAPSVGYPNLFQCGLLLLPELPPKRILAIGAGGLITPRQFHDTFPPNTETGYPGIVVDVVEVDRDVVEIAKRHFFPPSRGFQEHYAQRMNLHVADGRQFLREQPVETYDLIIIDAFSSDGQIPLHLATREFFQLCKSRLQPDGAVVMNVISALEGRKAKVFHAIYKTMVDPSEGELCFLPGQIYVGRMIYHPSDSAAIVDIPENVLIMCSKVNRRIPKNEIVARGRSLDQAYYQQQEESEDHSPPVLGGWVLHFAHQILDQDQVANFLREADAPPLTDDFSPIEFLHHSNFP